MDLRGKYFKRTARAPAKLNLFLEVLGRRDDGYHDLETLMVPLRLADQVSFEVSPSAAETKPCEILLDVRTCWPVSSAPKQQAVPEGPDNLIVKSLELLRKRSGCTLGARVGLVKRIPLAAGLGGGSSDAAAALRLANRGWQINWSLDRLSDLAAELGSDVPFFLSHGTAVCRGRGEQVERLRPGKPLHFVVVKPPADLQTSAVYDAYNSLSESQPQIGVNHLGRLKDSLYSARWGDLGKWMHNRLQAAAGLLSPWVDRLRSVFAEFDFVGHQLSGSGSAYFGVCRHAQHARRLTSILRTRQLGLVYHTRSCH